MLGQASVDPVSLRERMPQSRAKDANVSRDRKQRYYPYCKSIPNVDKPDAANVQCYCHQILGPMDKGEDQVSLILNFPPETELPA